VRVALGDVPETMLWTLYHRAVEAERPDGVLADPLAVELIARIEYPFEERFGDGGPFAQWQALRAKTFDRAIAAWLARHPGGTVVALGEGLETQFWRVDDGRCTWITVDLPEAIELREQLLPRSPRLKAIARSALDLGWIDEVDATAGVLITAQGLLMYLEPGDVRGLFDAVAARFPGQAFLFDAVARGLTGRPMRSGRGYQAPPWHWGWDRKEAARIRAVPGVTGLSRLRLPRGRGLQGPFLTVVGSAFLAVRLARFGQPS
jgi:O-methyltransferase involved in polyketide biosynthesis